MRPFDRADCSGSIRRRAPSSHATARSRWCTGTWRRWRPRWRVERRDAFPKLFTVFVSVRGASALLRCDDRELDVERVLHGDDAADRDGFNAERGLFDLETAGRRHAAVGELDADGHRDGLRDVADGELTGDA